VYVAGWLHSGRSGIPGMEGHGTVRKYRSGFPDTVSEIPARDQSLLFRAFPLNKWGKNTYLYPIEKSLGGKSTLRPDQLPFMRLRDCSEIRFMSPLRVVVMVLFCFWLLCLD
jgi:hypothetical protein